MIAASGQDEFRPRYRENEQLAQGLQIGQTLAGNEPVIPPRGFSVSVLKHLSEKPFDSGIVIEVRTSEDLNMIRPLDSVVVRSIVAVPDLVPRHLEIRQSQHE